MSRPRRQLGRRAWRSERDPSIAVGPVGLTGKEAESGIRSECGPPPGTDEILSGRSPGTSGKPRGEAVFYDASKKTGWFLDTRTRRSTVFLWPKPFLTS